MNIRKELQKGSTPLLVLGVLARGEMYGYQIIKTVELESERVFQMNEGTLYPILHAMEQEGLLCARWEQVEGSARKRKYYRITDKGRKALARDRAAWDTYRTAVDRVLGGVQDVTACAY